MAELEIEFNKLKKDYISNVQERNVIIEKMRNNLRNRGVEDVVYGEGDLSYRLDSDNVSDLFAIDFALRTNATSTKLTETTDAIRKNAESMNKYSPKNPYPQSK